MKNFIKIAISLATIISMGAFMSSCSSNEDDPISINEINGSCENANFKATGGEAEKEGIAKVIVKVESENTLIFYAGTLKGQEYFVRINNYTKDKSGALLTVSSAENSTYEIKSFYKGKKQNTEDKITEFKISFNGTHKNFDINLSWGKEIFSYKGKWDDKDMSLEFGKAMYVPSPIEKILGRYSKLTKAIYHYGKPRREKEDDVNKYGYSLGQLENEDLVFYLHDYYPGNAEYVYIKDYKAEEKDGKIFLSTPKNYRMPLVAQYSEGYPLDINPEDCYINNLSFEYDLTSHEFILMYIWGRGDDIYRMEGIWDTTLEPYTDINVCPMPEE